ncbi:hypothetical protein HZP81_17365 [Elizabethkingia anophelis]|uniref:DUF6371 domain-containing protein n=1 Tax=Elizabethkingia anophelis TaxID=1117645 RepID=UPI0038925977|nr:hypothetical protein [Elizabethkingia anophelis]MCT4146108.1 hypothetical protein [Elizabethkingia anophelis]
MNNYRFTLDRSSKKYKCPNCNQRSFVIFIDTETGELLHSYGRCDREAKCGCFLHPSRDGFDNFSCAKRPITQPQLQPSFHQKELVEISMNPSNNLLKYFELLFGHRKSREIQDQYKIGTLPEFNFGTVFWQIDNQNRVRGGKVIQYYENGKRTKYITWIHQFLKSKKQISEFNLSQCLFGLHLIFGDKNSTIAIVESEKTACIMSVVFPDFLWLACGAKGEFKIQKLEAIKHRKIIAYPDCEIQNNGSTTYQEWQRKADDFNRKGFAITVSDLLEKEATQEQKIKGIDIADFFMKVFIIHK